MLPHIRTHNWLNRLCAECFAGNPKTTKFSQQTHTRTASSSLIYSNWFPMQDPRSLAQTWRACYWYNNGPKHIAHNARSDVCGDILPIVFARDWMVFVLRRLWWKFAPTQKITDETDDHREYKLFRITYRERSIWFRLAMLWFVYAFSTHICTCCVISCVLDFIYVKGLRINGISFYIFTMHWRLTILMWGSNDVCRIGIFFWVTQIWIQNYKYKNEICLRLNPLKSIKANVRLI